MRRVLSLVALAGGVLFPIAASTGLAAEGDLPPASPPFQWVSIGPTIIDPTGSGWDVVGSTGRVSSMSVASTGLFVATANGGVWKRSSSGTWAPLTDGQNNLAFGAVAVASPPNENVIYAGTGEDHGACVDCAPGNDLYKSTDGGATWATLTPLVSPTPPSGMQTSSIAVNRLDKDDVWVGGTLGVFRSQNGGSTWTRIAAASPTDNPPTIVDLKLDPAHPGVAYFSNRRRVIKCDANANPPVLTDITAPSVAEYETQYPNATFAIALAVAPSNANVIYTAYAFSGNVQTGCMAGLYKSSDGGGTWVNVSVLNPNDYFSMAYAYGGGMPGCQGWYNNVLAVDPTDENHLVAGGVALVDFHTAAPATPQQRNLSKASNVHPDHHALAFDEAGNLYDGNDGGVWYFSAADLAPRAPDAPQQSGPGKNLSQGLAVTTFSSGVSLFPDGSGSIFAGSQDNGTELYSHGANGWKWKRLAMGDGFYTAVDPHNASVLYSEFETGKMQRSTNGGAAWEPIVVPFDGQAVSWGMPYRMDANNAAKMIAGAAQRFVTENRGDDWVGKEQADLWMITAIDWTPGAKTIVLGDSLGNFAYSFDSGTTWKRGQATGRVTVVKIDPYLDKTFWVASRSPSNPFVPYLLAVSQPANSPVSITNAAEGLSSPIESLLILPNVVIAGTDQGIYLHDHFGGTWIAQTSAQGPVIPAVPVVDLALRTYGQGNATASVVALTHGRGAWVSNDLAFIRPHSYAGMVRIPAGSFQMGDSLDGEADAMPTLSVNVSAFYMDENLVTYSQWRAVYQWATAHGYTFDRPGDGKGPNYPVSNISWYDMVKWCNARSEQAGEPPVYYTDAGFTSVSRTGTGTVYAKWTAAGYRLPTEAEWEKAARGGLSGKRFPWGDTIDEQHANYVGNTTLYRYDLGPNGNNPVGNGWTSPVGSFAANGYGLYDMTGNLWQWCWDYNLGGASYAGGTDPRGPSTGTARRMRGGSFYNNAGFARCAHRNLNAAWNPLGMIGFRTVLAPGP